MNDRPSCPRLIGAAMLCALSLVTDRAAAAQEPEAQACLREDYSQPAIPVFGHVTPKPYSAEEKACWIGVQEARDEGWMQLDVREVAMSARTLLPGTVALSLSSVAGRKYLREQPLVLVGTGVDLRALTSSCVALRAQGFARVRTLLGGARSWNQKPGGDLLIPQEFWLGAIDGQWRIVSVGLRADQIADLPIPPEVALSASTDSVGLRKALADAERAKPSELHHQWILVAPDGVGQQVALARWQQIPHQQGMKPLAWLEGGWTGYRTYLNQQQQSAAHAGRALPRICGS